MKYHFDNYLFFLRLLNNNKHKQNNVVQKKVFISKYNNTLSDIKLPGNEKKNIKAFCIKLVLLDPPNEFQLNNTNAKNIFNKK